MFGHHGGAGEALAHAVRERARRREGGGRRRRRAVVAQLGAVLVDDGGGGGGGGGVRVRGGVAQTFDRHGVPLAVQRLQKSQRLRERGR